MVARQGMCSPCLLTGCITFAPLMGALAPAGALLSCPRHLLQAVPHRCRSCCRHCVITDLTLACTVRLGALSAARQLLILREHMANVHNASQDLLPVFGCAPVTKRKPRAPPSCRPFLSLSLSFSFQTHLPLCGVHLQFGRVCGTTRPSQR